MIKLYANIGFGHENDWDCLYSRVVAAAQCNADAVIITKSTPSFCINENKKYVSMESKWGNLPFIEIANKSELDIENCKNLIDLTNQIGIPIIWCITDTIAGDWVKENTGTYNIKIHSDYGNNKELVDFCINSFDEIMYPGYGKYIDILLQKYPRSVDKEKLSLYHSTKKFPPHVEELNLKFLDDLKEIPNIKVGYEGKCEGIYPDVAVVLKNVDYIEKYLGDEEPFNDAILTHQKFYDFFVNMNQLEIAHGKN